MPEDRLDDTFRVLVVGENDAERSQLRAMLEQLSGASIRVVDPVSDPELTGAEVVAIIVGEDPAVALYELRRWSYHPCRPHLIALHHAWPLALMREMLQAGAHELVQMPPGADELELIFLKLAESRCAPEKRGNGRVYGVTGLSGRVGLTTLSAGLALAFRHALNRRVAILDLDLQNGGINLGLHLDPAETIVSLLDGLDRLDSIRLEAALTKHSAGIYVLAAPRRIEQAELVTSAAVGVILDLMRQLFDVVIVDCGRRVTDNALVAWERCAQVLYVTDQSLWSARRVPRFTQLFASLGLQIPGPLLVLNRFDKSAGVTREEVACAAETPLFACIPRDDRLMATLELRKDDLWRVAPASRLARAYEDLARRLEAPDASPEARRLVERLKIAIGMRA